MVGGRFSKDFEKNRDYLLTNSPKGDIIKVSKGIRKERINRLFVIGNPL